MVRFASLLACLAFVAPNALFAQSDADGADNTVDLDAIDALFSDENGEAAEGEDDLAEGEVPEPSDLTRAFNRYSICVQESGVALEETGFGLDVIGSESLLRCSGERTAYVNAFYFSLLPRYPDADEVSVRASAERLAVQSDRALIAMVTEEVTELREIRETQAEEADLDEEIDEEADDADADDGEAADPADEETAEQGESEPEPEEVNPDA